MFVRQFVLVCLFSTLQKGAAVGKGATVGKGAAVVRVVHEGTGTINYVN